MLTDNKEKDFRTHAFGFVSRHNPVHRVLEDVKIDYCYGCEEPESKDRYLYDFGTKKMCRVCLIQDIMVDLEDCKFSTDNELAQWYFNEGVDLSDAKDMIKTAWNDITERNLALIAKPITPDGVNKIIEDIKSIDYKQKAA